MTTTLHRVLRIRSHSGLARYLATVSDSFVGWIPRQADIRSPYAYAPSHGVYEDPQRGKVIIVETSHRCFDIFAVGDTQVFASDDDIIAKMG